MCIVRWLVVTPALVCEQVPVWLLKATRSFLKSFQWARDAADRLVCAPCVLVSFPGTRVA